MTRHGSTVLVADQEYPLISIGGVMTTLDEAWAEVEAVVPEGWTWSIEKTGDAWYAAAWPHPPMDEWDDRGSEATEMTPAKTLTELARKLARSLLGNPGGTE